MYLAVLMRRMGFQVVPAKNGVEVLKLIKMAPPDLVMLDYTMPVMDGLTALRTLVALDKDAKVVMVTSLGGVGDKYTEALKLEEEDRLDEAIPMIQADHITGRWPRRSER